MEKAESKELRNLNVKKQSSKLLESYTISVTDSINVTVMLRISLMGRAVAIKGLDRTQYFSANVEKL